MTKFERMKAAAAQGTGSAAGQRKSGKPRLKTPLMPGMGRPSLSGNSPVEPTRAAKIQARDKEMDDRGRWPLGTWVNASYQDHAWTVYVGVPLSKDETEPNVSWDWTEQGGGIHELLSKAYHAWLEAGKPGAS